MGIPAVYSKDMGFLRFGGTTNFSLTKGFLRVEIMTGQPTLAPLTYPLLETRA